MSAAVDAVLPQHSATLASPTHPGRQAAVERVETELTELWGHINAANYRFLKLLAEFDRLKGYEIYGLAGSAQWLTGSAVSAASPPVSASASRARSKRCRRSPTRSGAA